MTAKQNNTKTAAGIALRVVEYSTGREMTDKFAFIRPAQINNWDSKEQQECECYDAWTHGQMTSKGKPHQGVRTTWIQRYTADRYVPYLVLDEEREARANPIRERIRGLKEQLAAVEDALRNVYRKDPNFHAVWKQITDPRDPAFNGFDRKRRFETKSEDRPYANPTGWKEPWRDPQNPERWLTEEK